MYHSLRLILVSSPTDEVAGSAVEDVLANDESVPVLHFFLHRLFLSQSSFVSCLLSSGLSPPAPSSFCFLEEWLHILH